MHKCKTPCLFFVMFLLLRFFFIGCQICRTPFFFLSPKFPGYTESRQLGRTICNDAFVWLIDLIGHWKNNEYNQNTEIMTFLLISSYVIIMSEFQNYVSLILFLFLSLFFISILLTLPSSWCTQHWPGPTHPVPNAQATSKEAKICKFQ